MSVGSKIGEAVTKVEHYLLSKAEGSTSPPIRWTAHRSLYWIWILRRRPSPPPPVLKWHVLRHYARRFRIQVLVESGTYLGDTVEAMRDEFDEIHSIELSPALFYRATTRFATVENVHLHHGDSAEVMGQVVPKLDRSALFWLDGHYSGGETAHSELRTPVVGELEAILMEGGKGHVVLVDDARLFTGRNDYPTLTSLKAMVREQWPRAAFTIRDDIIRIAESEGGT